MKTLLVFLFVSFNTLALFSVENEEADVSITLTKPAKFTYDQYFAKQVDSLNEMLSTANYQTRNREAAMQMLDSIYKAMLLQLNDSVIIKSSDLYKLKNEIKELESLFSDKQRIEDYLRRIDFAENFDFQIYLIKLYENIVNYYIVGYYSEYIKTAKFILDSSKLSKSKEVFRKTALKNKTQFVLNVNSLNLKQIGSNEFVEMDLQLYDRETDSFLIDSVFISDNQNFGFEFSCQDGSINCFINNSIYNSHKLVINYLLQNGNGPQKVIVLGNKRYQIISELLNKSYNKSYLQNVLETEKKQNNLDSNINIEKMYFALINNSATKFVAFFNDYISFEDRNKLGRIVNIETRYDIRDSNYFKDQPQMATYLVKGEKYKDKWYLDNPSVNLVQADDFLVAKRNLLYKTLKDSYFTNNDTTFNNQFWDIGLFEKVEDISKTEKWNLYRDMYEKNEKKYRKYIGITQFVADELVKLDEIALDLFIDKKRSELDDFVKKTSNYLKKQYNDSILFIVVNKKQTIIYDSSFSYVILPYVIKLNDTLFEIQSIYLDKKTNKVYECSLNKSKRYSLKYARENEKINSQNTS